MDLVKTFESLEDAAFRFAAWSLLLPKTLWNCLIRPMRVLDYVDLQLSTPAKEGERFDEFVSPVSLWLALAAIPSIVALNWLLANLRTTILFSQLPETARGLTFETQLTVFGAFLLTPLLAPSCGQLVLERKKISRANLRGPFYAHCVLLAPRQFALLVCFSMYRIFGVTIRDWHDGLNFEVGMWVVQIIAALLCITAGLAAISYPFAAVRYYRKSFNASYLSAVALCAVPAVALYAMALVAYTVFIQFRLYVFAPLESKLWIRFW